MEQIYYTQCPVGYGLGASNGFQVKRLSRGYPMSGDFRHLGLKAYPGGGRVLAPATLRYRRDGNVAEVAWLTPRANEYETERGLWGRPGGHFAHGLRLDPAEMKAIHHWPAGLFGGSAWVRSDREPSRGRLPDELDLGPASLSRPPTFAAVAPAADREDPVRLARLLTALAQVTREGRTLFLIDQPERLGPLVALLTFAFPERFRDDLTFSTYHDRPEELPGFRISGTIPLARPNKPALTAQGIVADLTIDVFEPRIEPAAWASTLAGWLTRHDAFDEADWSATDARARQAKGPGPDESPWVDDWLGPLHAYPSALRSRVAPGDPPGWAALETFHGWLGRSGLADEWTRPRNPAWWAEAAGAAREWPEARAALVSHASLRDAWRGDSTPARWGDIVATWFRAVEPDERDRSLTLILKAAPRSARPAFARALLKGLTPEGAEAVLDQLRADPAVDRAMLLPLEASASVAAILAGNEGAPLAVLVEEARAWPGASVGVLDAIEAGIEGLPEELSRFASLSVVAFDPEAAVESRDGIVWALRRGPIARAWLGPAFRPVLADLGRPSAWVALRDALPEDLRPDLARAVLAIAAEEGLPDEAFRWGVEALLMPLAPRPTDPSWADTYLRRIPSDLELLRRLVAPESRKLGLPAWINQARARGEVSDEQASRVDGCLDYARALSSKDPNALLKIELPGVPEGERGKLLDQMLKHAVGPSMEGLPFVLEAARRAWPGAFDPGSAGLRSLAGPLARCLIGARLAPGPWLARVSSIIEKLGLIEGHGHGFEPDGLAAEMLSTTTRSPEADAWALRQYLLRQDAWPILAADVRRDLGEVRTEVAPEVLDRWDRQLTKEKPERFFELFLNACEPGHLAAIVPRRAADLTSLPPLAWWDHPHHPDSLDDLRDGFARVVPLVPLPIGTISPITNWIEGRSAARARVDLDAPIGVDESPEPQDGALGPAQVGPKHLSALGHPRWRCLLALTNFEHAGTEAVVRWRIVQAWEADLPLGLLATDDRYRFLAWLILGLDSAESYQLSRLAAWLKRSGMKDPARIARWAEELDGLTEVPDNRKLFRSGMVGELRTELFRAIRDDRESKPARAAGRP